jgi:hypothetical protein
MGDEYTRRVPDAAIVLVVRVRPGANVRIDRAAIA